MVAGAPRPYRTSPRVGLVVKADIRAGYSGQLTAKVARIEEALADGPS